MKKTINKVDYDTDCSYLIKKVTYGCFGDAKGYEETLYKTDSGNYFLYVNGGADSLYPAEDIHRMAKSKAEAWVEEHR